MRGRLAATSADRISRAVVLMAGVSCGALVLFVGLPLARSSPYPTPRDGGWVIQQAAPSYQLASATTMPGAIEPQEQFIANKPSLNLLALLMRVWRAYLDNVASGTR